MTTSIQSNDFFRGRRLQEHALIVHFLLSISKNEREGLSQLIRIAETFLHAPPLLSFLLPPERAPKVLAPSFWPAPPTIHRGLEWRQFLNSLFSVCLFSVCLWANFLICYSTVQYSIVQYSTVQYSTVRNLFFKRSGHTVQYGTL